MPDSEKRTKPKYEAPVVVALGKMAKGTGYCFSGSNPEGSDSYCKSGTTASGYCESGGSAVGYCSNGLAPA